MYLRTEKVRSPHSNQKSSLNQGNFHKFSHRFPIVSRPFPMDFPSDARENPCAREPPRVWTWDKSCSELGGWNATCATSRSCWAQRRGKSGEGSCCFMLFCLLVLFAWKILKDKIWCELLFILSLKEGACGARCRVSSSRKVELSWLSYFGGSCRTQLWWRLQILITRCFELFQEHMKHVLFTHLTSRLLHLRYHTDVQFEQLIFHRCSWNCSLSVFWLKALARSVLVTALKRCIALAAHWGSCWTPMIRSWGRRLHQLVRPGTFGVRKFRGTFVGESLSYFVRFFEFESFAFQSKMCRGCQGLRFYV